MKMIVQRTSEFASIPTYGSDAAAGMDLYADFSSETGSVFCLNPGHRKLFKTGVIVALPEGTYGRIAPRSGLAYKKGIDVMAGVVDQDYRGEVGVILVNHGNEEIVIEHGDRIAQMIVTPYVKVYLEEDAMEDTERGLKGFGSTGS